jgi:hypothetical protein
MFIDPIIKQQCPRGVNPLTFHVLQRLWWEGKHISTHTAQTSMRGVNLHASVQFDNNDGKYTIISFN